MLWYSVICGEKEKGKKKEKCQKISPSPAGIRTPDSWKKLSRPRFEFWRKIRSIELTFFKKSQLYACGGHYLLPHLLEWVNHGLWTPNETWDTFALMCTGEVLRTRMLLQKIFITLCYLLPCNFSLCLFFFFTKGLRLKQVALYRQKFRQSTLR